MENESMENSSGLLCCCTLMLAFLSMMLVHFRRQVYVILVTLRRDLRLIIRFLMTSVYMHHYRRSRENIITLFQKRVREDPEKVIFKFEEITWTRKQLEEYSNRIANTFLKHGYRKGDVVALLSNNRPEYVGIWLGLGKIGVTVALINTHIKSHSLVHCITVANCRALIFTSDFDKEVEAIRGSLPDNIELIIDGKSPRFDGLTTFKMSDAIDASSEPVDISHIRGFDNLLYIYTSGTTGLPKAAMVSHRKLVYMACGLMWMFWLERSDIIYDPLPLYHSAGGLVGVIPSITFGLTTVLRAKFSASSYFADCVKHKCTVGQYIGEMCRYILGTNPSPNDRAHSLRMIVGNGMRADVWKLFVDRFKIPLVLELYGSTEGNANIVNTDNTIGAVGFVPQIVPAFLFPIALIRYDEATSQPIRDKNRLCIRCKPGEDGMCIGLINPKDPVKDFQGYVDKTETDNKIIKDVFKIGDRAFVSGDILYQDEFGYLFFKDRTGDTFRWKGENVSTNEVEMIVSKLIKFKDCTVYGVEVGDLEGRAGMVAIADPSRQVDLAALAEGLDNELPSYARPVFVRLVTNLNLTGTFKVQKTDLRNQGINPDVITDPLFYRDQRQGFCPLTREAYDAILANKIKI